MRINQITFAVICVVIAVAPVPLGSNRPFFWLINALIVSTLAAAYVLGLWANSSQLRVPLADVSIPASLYLIAPIWMLVQLLPISALSLPPPLWAEAGAALGGGLPARISIDAAATVGMIVRFLTLVLFFFLVLQVTANRDRARKLFEVVFWITVAHAAIAILMLFEFGDRLIFFWPKWAYPGAATGFFVNRNSFATYVGCGLIAGVTLRLDRDRARRDAGTRTGPLEVLRDHGAHAAGIAILISALFLSTSRMGAFSAAIGTAVAFALAARRHRSGLAGTTPLLVAVVGIAATILIVSGGNLTDRLGSAEDNLNERLLLYRQVVDMIATRPWTGFGGGTFSEAFQLFHRLPLSGDVVWNAAHNLYLELFADLGFVAIAPIFAIALLFFGHVRSLNARGIAWVAPAGATATLIAVAMHSMIDFSLQIEANALLVTAILAAGTAQATRASRTEAGAHHVPAVGKIE
jgi:O-antigen ligase